MNSAVICAVLLTVLQGSVFAGISFEGKIESRNEEAKIFPNPGKPAASNTSHSGRIIKGYEGRIESIPFIVHLRVDLGDGWMSGCGASIISYTYALTAAHCVFSYNASSITLYGGSTSKYRGGTVFQISNYAIHPNFNPYNKTSDYDVAIIKVKGTFQGYRNVESIALQDAEVPAGTRCYAVGWGINNITAQTSPENVQYAFLLASSPEKCSVFGKKTIFCAQQGNGVNTYDGDSGGPLVCNGKLTGVSSFVGEGCRSDVPAAFAKVMNPSIRQFIRKYTGV